MSEKLRIMIVDDDYRMTHTLADILVLQGYDVVEAHSGRDAIERAQQMIFDCVLTDIHMPEMNGVELSRQLRALQPDLPVVMMTAYAADELIRQGLEEGVIGVLEKPLTINNLLGFFTSLDKTCTVAIVDDDPAFCQTLADLLERRAYRVVKITEPDVSNVDQIAFDAQVVLLDLKLNTISGVDLLKLIRSLYPALPVVIITGYRHEMAGAIQQAFEYNAYACLYKPLVMPDLMQKLTEIRLEHLRSLLSDSSKLSDSSNLSDSSQ